MTWYPSQSFLEHTRHIGMKIRMITNYNVQHFDHITDDYRYEYQFIGSIEYNNSKQYQFLRYTRFVLLQGPLLNCSLPYPGDSSHQSGTLEFVCSPTRTDFMLDKKMPQSDAIMCLASLEGQTLVDRHEILGGDWG